MTTTDALHARRQADQFGRAVADRLSHATDGISHEARERLRAARVRAVAARRQPAGGTVAVRNGHGAASPARADGKRSLFNRIASVLPLLLLAAGLVLLHGFEGDRRATELAEVDAALLTDDLPPEAYTDPGFLQFLKQGGRERDVE